MPAAFLMRQDRRMISSASCPYGQPLSFGLSLTAGVNAA